ncbi:MAG: 4,5:9,10-diseco-3-hydroxy-5,9,17-trioxoandrosta(10),2-diene-4-oate hydrolase [Chloroflexota bacterium]|nr:4,5:9,10-diseco-3-hydroxy-5,9,17-trioxoandrosta(10),2-diene-4-oate hydrolase [Chloroflexota bacterium]
MQERMVRADGLWTRYLEEGSGPPLLLLHGAAQGSSADVWTRNLGPLASHGLRVIAVDQPGFGGSDDPPDFAPSYRQNFITPLLDALGISRVALVAHSQAGGLAIGYAIDHPERLTHLVTLSTGSIMPPTPSGEMPISEAGANPDAPEPTEDVIRGILEEQLYHHDLITPEVIRQRLDVAVGHNHEAWQRRIRAQRAAGGGGGLPAWKRIAQVKVPMLAMWGAGDENLAAQRVPVFREVYPSIQAELLDHAKHLMQWDRADEVVRLTTEFLAS